jgi:hypothetical protein
MEAIDNNRFFYISQWKNCPNHALFYIPFVRSHLQLAPAAQIAAYE